jgi:aspartyl-tRNA(Asn)/glutamyl-tRNA(Gln) amidotransferase subunit A
LVEEAIANHTRLGATLNAYKTWDPDRARAQAKAADALLGAGVDLGPLHGLPISVKDLYGVAGYPTFAGTPKALPAKWQQEGPVVRHLRAAMAVITGKTHTVEFAFGGIGTNPHWGAPRNPWDAADHRAPGGSSSGAGVSLGEGSALVAFGSDTAGSVRVPASMTGTVALKTSAGRWSTEGIVPLSPTLDTAGLLTRTVADAVIAFQVVDPLVDETAPALLARLQQQPIAGLRIGICDWFFQDCAPGIAEAVKGALGELEAKGARLSTLRLPEVDEAMALFRRGGVAAAEFATFINTEMQAYRATLDPNVRQRFEAMEQIPAVDYLTRLWRLRELAQSTDGHFDQVDVVITPTVPITPPKVADMEDGEAYRVANMLALRNTAPANLLSLCALSMPVALDGARMPVGLQIMARLGEDEPLLGVALAIERVLGTAQERLGTPPLAAS